MVVLPHQPWMIGRKGSYGGKASIEPLLVLGIGYYCLDAGATTACLVTVVEEEEEEEEREGCDISLHQLHHGPHVLVLEKARHRCY